MAHISSCLSVRDCKCIIVLQRNAIASYVTLKIHEQISLALLLIINKKYMDIFMDIYKSCTSLMSLVIISGNMEA
jgi:hypothetical protein